MPFCWHAGRRDTCRALSRTALPMRGTFPAGRGTSRQSHFRGPRPEAVQGKRRWMHLAAFPTPRAVHRSCGTQGPLQDAEPELLSPSCILWDRGHSATHPAGSRDARTGTRGQELNAWPWSLAAAALQFPWLIVEHFPLVIVKILQAPRFTLRMEPGGEK